MATESKSRRRRRKKIVRRTDGSLFDATERRRITTVELRDYVRDGGLFEARRQENGADCTYEVLQGVMGAGMLQNLVPGLGSGPLSGLAGLSALSGGGGGGPLAALGGAGGLADLARVLGDERGRSRDRDRDDDWDDWDGDERRRPRRSADGRTWGSEGWADPPQRSSKRDRRDDDWASDPEFD